MFLQLITRYLVVSAREGFLLVFVLPIGWLFYGGTPLAFHIIILLFIIVIMSFG